MVSPDGLNTSSPSHIDPAVLARALQEVGEESENKDDLVEDLAGQMAEDQFAGGAHPVGDSVYETLAEHILSRGFSDIQQGLRGRAKAIVLSRLKGVRDSLETRERLEVKEAEGGLEMEPSAAESAAKEIEVYLQNLSRGHAQITEQELHDWHKQHATGESSSSAKIMPKEEAVRSAKMMDIQPPAELLPVSSVSPIRNASFTPRVAKNTHVTDVFPSPRITVGPMEELRAMRFIDFRHRSSDPEVAAEQIHSKIELLTEESLSRKIAGIRAWQESPLFQNYLGVLMHAVATLTPIEEVLADTSVNSERISMDEFYAIAGLSGTLHF